MYVYTSVYVKYLEKFHIKTRKKFHINVCPEMSGF